jgi:hypothetical protein
MATIADMTGIGRGDVPRSISRLEKLGLLKRQSRAGHSAVNVYIVILNGEEVSVPEPTGVSNDADRMSAPMLTGCQQIRPLNVSTGADQTDHQQTNEQNHARRASRMRAIVSEDGASEFEVFWQVYPSRSPHANPQKLAREALETALKRGIGPRVIIRGAENYAACVELNAIDRRYVAQAVTWLRQERWNDHQQAPAPLRLRAGMN